jgi:hypothetical protein
MTLLSQLPHGRWYSYNAEWQPVGTIATRGSPIYSVAEALGITQLEVDAGLKACGYFRLRRSTIPGCYQNMNTEGQQVSLWPNVEHGYCGIVKLKRNTLSDYQ